MKEKTMVTGTCICGSSFVHEGGHRVFCSSTCAKRAAAAVMIVERSRDFLAGYVLAQHEPDGTAGKVLKNLLSALDDVRKGPGSYVANLKLKLAGSQSMQEGFTRGYWVDETGATVRQETDAEFRERVRKWG